MRAARRDNNESILVDTARRLGALMVFIGHPCDWLLGFRGRWYVVEIKALRGTYTDSQKVFIDHCQRHDLPFLTWRTEEDVYDSLGAKLS